MPAPQELHALLADLEEGVEAALRRGWMPTGLLLGALRGLRVRAGREGRGRGGAGGRGAGQGGRGPGCGYWATVYRVVWHSGAAGILYVARGFNFKVMYLSRVTPASIAPRTGAAAAHRPRARPARRW